MKPYVNQAGIKKENIKVTVSGLTFTLDGFSRTKRQGENVIAVLPNPHKVGKKCIDYISLDRHPEIETIRKSAEDSFESAFVARYPGIYTLVTAINDEHNYHESFNRMMDDESNDGVRPPVAPKMTIEQARQQYPIAAAYLTILSYADADPSSQVGYNRRRCGDDAITQLEGGADVIKTRDAMVKRYNEMPIEDRS